MDNEVRYQNGLSLNNLPFARACGKLLTNYCWTEDQATDSLQIASECSIAPENVFFGIDVWAQNSSGFTHPRTTYPRLGGGGTNTGIAVAKLAELGLSAGVFAPAWSFEHFPGRGKEIERVMWGGEALPGDIDCSCGNSSFRHQATGPCIDQYARLTPAGSESFFFTDFAPAFKGHGKREKEEIYGGHARHAQLGYQAPFPLPKYPASAHEGAHLQVVRCLDEPVEGPSKVVIEYRGCPTTTLQDREEPSLSITLFRFDMLADYSLHLTIKYRCLLKDAVNASSSLYLKFTDHEQRLPLLNHKSEGIRTLETRLGTSSSVGNRKACFEELSIDLQGLHGTGTVPILEIYSISIVPDGHHTSLHQHHIHGIHAVHRGEGENKHVRLRWEYAVNSKGNAKGVPYSELTGPFSHFVVRMSGIQVGRAYALEHIVSRQLAEALANKDVEVEITGIGFDGEHLAHQKITIRMDSE